MPAVWSLMADAIDFDIVLELDRGFGPVYHHMFNFYLFRYLASRSDIPATTLSYYVLFLVLMICRYFELFGTVLGWGAKEFLSWAGDGLLVV